MDAWQRVVEWARYIREEWDAALDILLEFPSALV